MLAHFMLQCTNEHVIFVEDLVTIFELGLNIGMFTMNMTEDLHYGHNDLLKRGRL